MEQLLLYPNGWKCTLSKCPPGLFVFDKSVCFKTEYTDDGYSEVFCESGEAFWGGTSSKDERENIIVQPVQAIWEEL